MCEPGETCFWAAAPGFTGEFERYRFSCQAEFGDALAPATVWVP
ncbi:MAG: hypothetical protein AAFQ82_09705 [Myxococcota bacterium]